MKQLFFLFITFLALSSAKAQLSIRLDEAGQHVGDSVKVCGKVAGTRYFDNSKEKTTLLNLGAAFPNQQLTVVIKGDLRKEFEKAPDELFKEKNVCIIGTVELYRDKPQIVLHYKWQIGIE